MLDELDLSVVSRACLESLNELTGETVLLTMLAGTRAFYADKVDSKHQIRMYAEIGRPVEYHCTGAGKAILAHATDVFNTMRAQGHPLKRFTSTTLTTYEALDAELSAIRSRGYAFDNQEHEEHINCIAAPLFSARGAVAGAVSIVAPVYRFDLDALENRFSEPLLEAANSVSGNLGARSAQTLRKRAE